MPENHPPFTAFEGETYCHWYRSPFGELLITGNQSAVTSLTFPNKNKKSSDAASDTNLLKDPDQFKEVCTQLDLYFDGKLENFDLPLAPRGTKFQLSVWTQLMKAMVLLLKN